MKVISRQQNNDTCFVCGAKNNSGIQARFYNMEDDSVGALFTFKETHQGFPTQVHGGLVSTLLDELAMRTIWVKFPETICVTANMTVKFRNPVPYNKELSGRGYLISAPRRIFKARAEIFDENKKVLAEIEANYVILPPNKIDYTKIPQESMNFVVKDDIKNIDFSRV